MTNLPYEKKSRMAAPMSIIAILKHLKYIKISKSYFKCIYLGKPWLEAVFKIKHGKYIQNQYLCLITWQIKLVICSYLPA